MEDGLVAYENMQEGERLGGKPTDIQVPFGKAGKWLSMEEIDRWENATTRSIDNPQENLRKSYLDNWSVLPFFLKSQ